MSQRISDQFIPIVLCAGFGTRLSPLTKFIPKVACPILNKPIAFLNIEQFFHAGFEKVHCNTHYLAETVQQELIAAASYFGYDPRRIVFWHEDDILETGGGIARIYHELSKQDVQNSTKDLLVVSGDLVSNFPIQKMIEIWRHKQPDEMALMGTRQLIQQRKDMTWVSSDAKHVIGFGESDAEQAKTQNASSRLFSNHQIISHQLVKPCPVEKCPSVALFFKSALKQNQKILHYEMPESEHWFNVGTVPEYLECIRFFDKENPNKSENLIINYAHRTPKILKEKIDHYFAENPEGEIPTALNESIVISFLDCRQKGNAFVSIKTLFDKESHDMPGGEHFYFCV